MTRWPGVLPEEAWRYRTGVRRFLAMWADVLFLSPLMVVDWLLGEIRLAGVPAVAWVLFYLSVSLAYTLVGHALFGGTPGKRALRLMVLDLDGNYPGWRRAAIRDAMLIFYFLYDLTRELPRAWAGLAPFDEYTRGDVTAFDRWMMFALHGWVILEFVTMLFNEKRRAVHDFMAGTVVIRTGSR